MDLTQYEAGAVAGIPIVPVAPSVGNPTNGDAALSIPATKPGEYWYYQMQQELNNLIAQAGITPDHTDLTQIYTAVQALIAASSSALHGQCQLTKDGTELKLSPFNGNKLIINGAVETIPDAGVTLAPTGLVADTLYRIYAYMNAGTMTLEADETVHSPQANTGVEIKNGDATRTFVGIARTITGVAWQDDRAQRFVRSWFNSRAIEMVNAFDSNKTTTSLTTFVELSSTDRIEFLTFVHESVMLSTSGRQYNSNPGGSGAMVSIGIDGTTPQDTNSDGLDGAGAIAVPSVVNVTKSGFTEGYHYATIIARHSPGSGSGTLTFYGGADPATADRNAINGIIIGG